MTGEDLDIKGQQSVSFTLNGREYSHTFMVCSLTTDAAGLLGTDFLKKKKKTGAVIHLKCGQMSHVGKVSRVYSVPPAGHAALRSSLRVKQGTALCAARRRRGTQTKSSQPAPVLS